ncbi:hypothetical protein [Arthrobacter sp. H14-L1]|uniref:hypothetical protein n=1 Tax=Arthrobacter sp. H14-L1 TaxID=2996697 RepID=UPI00226F0830|nr:hypothetical protein [Arthrobacter sp. H14-L1]MCY0905758.1 hypothetical protein [Arthrobacter sp. H14-L1]
MPYTPPQDFDLDTLNLVQGPDIDERASQSQINDACDQEGAQDAAKGLYDKHSFHPDRHLLFEHKVQLWLEKYAGGALIRQWKDERAAMHIVSRARAEATQLTGRLQSARAALKTKDAKVDVLLSRMTDRAHESYVPDIELRTSPVKPGQDKRQRTRTWSPKLLAYITLGAIGEFAINVLAGFVLGEEEWKTYLLAGLITFITIAVPLQAAPALMSSKGTRTIGKAIAWTALGFLALVIAGFAWIRYTYMKGAVEAALTAAQHSGGKIVAGGLTSVHLDTLGTVMLILLNIALPLCLALLIFTEILHNKQALISELRHLRQEQSNLDEETQSLEKMCLLAHQQAADAEHDYHRIPGQTQHYLRALIPMVGEGLHCYIHGVARTSGDPTITAYLQDNAKAYAERYNAYANQVISDYLGRVNKPASNGRISHWRVGTDGIVRSRFSPETSPGPTHDSESENLAPDPTSEWTVPSEWEPTTEDQTPNA